MKKYLFALFVVCLVISACSPKPASSSLIGTWKLTAYGPLDSPIPSVPEANASITFDADGTLSGNGGCNILGGEYKVKGDTVTFGSVMSTLMACDEPRMAQESVVHQVLSDTADFLINGNTLTITNQDMSLVFELVAGE